MLLIVPALVIAPVTVDALSTRIPELEKLAIAPALRIPPVIVVASRTWTPASVIAATVPLLTILPMWVCPSLKMMAVTVWVVATVGFGMGLGFVTFAACAPALIPAAMASADVVVRRRLPRLARETLVCDMGRSFGGGGVY